MIPSNQIDEDHDDTAEAALTFHAAVATDTTTTDTTTNTTDATANTTMETAETTETTTTDTNINTTTADATPGPITSTNTTTSTTTATPAALPSRTVLCLDTTKWLQQIDAFPGSVVTSIPDFSEINMAPQDYKPWFVQIAGQILTKLTKDESAPSQVAIFYQTDCKITDSKGVVSEWIGKSFLLQQAAQTSGCRLLFHKIALIKEVGGVGRRPTFSHVLCFTAQALCCYRNNQVQAYPDVTPRGDVLWAKGMGTQATMMAVKFVRDVVKARMVVDPFCGKGTVLAAANFLGMDAIGVELSSVRCTKSRKLQWEHLFGDEAKAKQGDQSD